MIFRKRIRDIAMRSACIGLLYQLLYPNTVDGMFHYYKISTFKGTYSEEIINKLKNISPQDEDEVLNILKEISGQLCDNSIDLLNDIVLKTKQSFKGQEKDLKILPGKEKELKELVDNTERQNFSTFPMDYADVFNYWQTLKGDNYLEKYRCAITKPVSSEKDLQHAFFKHFFHPFLVLPIVQRIAQTEGDGFNINRAIRRLESDMNYFQIKSLILSTNTGEYSSKVFDLPRIALQKQFFTELSKYLDAQNPEHCFYFSAIITYWMFFAFKDSNGMICFHNPHSEGCNPAQILSVNFQARERIPVICNGNNDTYAFIAIHESKKFATVYPLFRDEVEKKLKNSILQKWDEDYSFQIEIDHRDILNRRVESSENKVSDTSVNNRNIPVILPDQIVSRSDLPPNFVKNPYPRSNQPKKNYNQHNNKDYKFPQRKNIPPYNQSVLPVVNEDNNKQMPPKANDDSKLLSKNTQDVKATDANKVAQEQNKKEELSTKTKKVENTQSTKKAVAPTPPKEKKQPTLADKLSKDIDKIAKQLNKLKSNQKTEEIKAYIKNPYSMIPQDSMDQETRYMEILSMGEKLLERAKRTDSPVKNAEEEKIPLPTKDEKQTVNNPLDKIQATNQEDTVPQQELESFHSVVEELNIKLMGNCIETITEWLSIQAQNSDRSVADNNSGLTTLSANNRKILEESLKYLCTIVEKMYKNVQPSQGKKKFSTTDIVKNTMKALADANKQYTQLYKELQKISIMDENFTYFPYVSGFLSTIKDMWNSSLTFPNLCIQALSINEQINEVYQTAKEEVEEHRSNEQIRQSLKQISDFVTNRSKLALLEKLLQNQSINRIKIFEFLQNISRLSSFNIYEELIGYIGQYSLSLGRQDSIIGDNSSQTQQPNSSHGEIDIMEEVNEALRIDEEMEKREREEENELYLKTTNDECANLFGSTFLDTYSQLTLAQPRESLQKNLEIIVKMFQGIEVWEEIFKVVANNPNLPLKKTLGKFASDKNLTDLSKWLNKLNSSTTLEAAQNLFFAYMMGSSLGDFPTPYLSLFEKKLEDVKERLYLPLVDIIPEESKKNILERQLKTRSNILSAYGEFFEMFFSHPLGFKTRNAKETKTSG